MIHSKSNYDQRHGLTLVELLVVVAIVSIITVMLVPQLRMVTKDRAIREAAREVGSVFSKAANRAQFEDGAGLLIERNLNFVDDGGVHFAGTSLYLMRNLPPYGGDDPPGAAGANQVFVVPDQMWLDNNSFTSIDYPLAVGGVENRMQVAMTRPLEHTQVRTDVGPNDEDAIIRPGDFIRLNFTGTRYLISRVQRSGGTLFLDLNLSADHTDPSSPVVYPTLADESTPKFLVYRKPKRLETSRIDLPEGYIVDLRYSGIANQVTGIPVTNSAATDNVQIYFDEAGGVDRVYPEAASFTWPITQTAPLNSVFFLITEYDPETAHGAALTAGSSIFDPSSMWISVDRLTGSVNVAYNSPPALGLSWNQTLENARALATGKQSANQ